MTLTLLKKLYDTDTTQGKQAGFGPLNFNDLKFYLFYFDEIFFLTKGLYHKFFWIWSKLERLSLSPYFCGQGWSLRECSLLRVSTL
jgi:hypothetical protein